VHCARRVTKKKKEEFVAKGGSERQWKKEREREEAPEIVRRVRATAEPRGGNPLRPR